MRKEVIGDATLYLGDCREVLPGVVGIGAIVADPPYGIDRHSIGCRKNDNRVRFSAFSAGKKIMGDGRQFDPTHMLGVAPQTIVWGANHYASFLPNSAGWLIWDKRVNPEFYGTTDQSDCELAWTNVSGAARIWRQIWNGIVRQGVEANTPKLHPTQKPIALMRWCVEKTVGMVCDPYMGSGTTGAACVELRRPFVGIEIDPEHFAVACKRIEQAQRQGSLLLPRVSQTRGNQCLELF